MMLPIPRHTLLVAQFRDLPIDDATQRAALVERFKKAFQEQDVYVPS